MNPWEWRDYYYRMCEKVDKMLVAFMPNTPEWKSVLATSEYFHTMLTEAAYNVTLAEMIHERANR